MIDCEFDTLILSLVLIWIFYVFNFILQLSKFITVYSSVDKHGAKGIGDYVTRFPSSAVKNLETQGTIVVGDTSNPDISMVKVNLAFKVSWDNFFSKGSDTLASSGVMERLLVERLYSDL